MFKTFSSNNQVDYSFLAISILTVFAFTLMPDLANAQTTTADTDLDTNSGINRAICQVVEELQGNIARGIAALGVIFLGLSLFLGKISWGVALTLGIGIGAIFGARDIVEVLSGGEVDCPNIS